MRVFKAEFYKSAFRYNITHFLDLETTNRSLNSFGGAGSVPVIPCSRENKRNGICHILCAVKEEEMSEKFWIYRVNSEYH